MHDISYDVISRPFKPLSSPRIRRDLTIRPRCGAQLPAPVLAGRADSAPHPAPGHRGTWSGDPGWDGLERADAHGSRGGNERRLACDLAGPLPGTAAFPATSRTAAPRRPTSPGPWSAVPAPACRATRARALCHWSNEKRGRVTIGVLPASDSIIVPVPPSRHRGIGFGTAHRSGRPTSPRERHPVAVRGRWGRPLDRERHEDVPRAVGDRVGGSPRGRAPG